MTAQKEEIVRDKKSAMMDSRMWVIVSGVTGSAEETADLKSESDDELVALLKAVKTRDRFAFEALYDATIQRIFGLAMRITRQQELADEVVSDVYLQVWQKADSYSPGRGKAIAWLCVLCRSRALDAVRRDNTALRQATVGLDSARDLEEPDELQDLLLAVEQGSAIHAALGELSVQQRQLLALAYFRGLTHTELGAFMGVPIGTVKTQLHRAVIKLRELMSTGVTLNGESHE